MHSLIGIIIYAVNEKSALTQAKEIMEELVENKYFDWYQTFDEGDHRFGDLPQVMNAERAGGRVFINCLMGYTMTKFFEVLSIVRKTLISKTDLEIWEARADKEMIRHCFNQLGSYGGSEIHLYDNDGEGIREPSHLHSALNKWPTLDKEHTVKYDNLSIYVVPVDAHS